MRADLPAELDALTEKILGAAFTVANTLGNGFLEVIYKNALAEELISLNCRVAAEKPFSVFYRDKLMGTYLTDLVVENQVIVELKAIETLSRAHQAQLLNYLKASKLPVGLLLNFGTPSLQMKRILNPSVKSVKIREIHVLLQGCRICRHGAATALTARRNLTAH